jgi:hypothetical protein
MMLAVLTCNVDDYQRPHSIRGWNLIYCCVVGCPVCWRVQLRAVLICLQQVARGLKTAVVVATAASTADEMAVTPLLT